MATYDSRSPYYTTTYSQFFLDVMNNRPIPKQDDDLQFEINLTYQYRPDLLALTCTTQDRCGGYSIKEIPTPCKHRRLISKWAR
jgi:hypothetical protein